MTDKERLNLIEHYKWTIVISDMGVAVFGNFGRIKETTLRRAIDAALKAQAEWALAK